MTLTRLRTPLLLLASLAVGGTFVVAGVLKSLDVDGFARDIALHGIIGPGLSAISARILIPLEITAGAAAILGYRRRAALSWLLLLLLVFMAATAWAWHTGHTEGCGCFGRFASRTPLSVIVEDGLLVAAALLAFVLSPREGERGRPRRAFVLGLLAVASTIFTLASPSLPLDAVATALRAGVSLHDLGLDRIAGDLDEGDRILVILVLDEEASQKAVPILNEISQTKGISRLTALTSSDEEGRAAFFFSYAPGFELLEVPAPDLRRLYRRAPRTFRVHNGRVLQVWEGIPPAKELTQ